MMHHFYGPGINLFSSGNLWWMGVNSVIHIILWIVVIYLAFKLVNKYFHKEHESHVKQDTAMSILRERYAKGEIDTEEFTQRKAELE